MRAEFRSQTNNIGDCKCQRLKELCSLNSIGVIQDGKKLQSVVHYNSFLQASSFCKAALKEGSAFEGFCCVGTVLHQTLAQSLLKALRIDSICKIGASACKGYTRLHGDTFFNPHIYKIKQTN